MAFRVLHGQAPPYLSHLVHVADLPGRQRLRSASSCQLSVPAYRLSTIGRRSFSVAPSTVWNSLPVAVQSSPTLSVFVNDWKHTCFVIRFLIFHSSFCLSYSGPCDIFCYLGHLKNFDLHYITLLNLQTCKPSDNIHVMFGRSAVERRSSHVMRATRLRFPIAVRPVWCSTWWVG
jgi:hypothetical protein